MRAIPKFLTTALGVITLMSVSGVSNADPSIISTYKDRNSAVVKPESSTAAKTKTAASATTTGTTTSKVTTPTYAIPSNFDFNCATRNPNSDAIENGRRAYLRLNCNVCHSGTGHGGTMGPSLVGESGEVAEAVSQGEEGGMPSFKKYLCPNDLADLKAYISSLSTKSAPDFTDWWVAHPPAPFVDSAP